VGDRAGSSPVTRSKAVTYVAAFFNILNFLYFSLYSLNHLTKLSCINYNYNKKRYRIAYKTPNRNPETGVSYGVFGSL
jgi:hypothetical protein